MTLSCYNRFMTVIDEYLDTLPGPQKAELERVRSIIKRAAPAAEEAISYGVPAFRQNNKYLIGFSAFKDHMSVFPGSEAIAMLKDELKKFKLSKGTIQFTLENPLPEPLLKKIVAYCLEAAAKR